PRASEVTGSCSPTPHALRAYALRQFILPRYLDDHLVSEVIVAGEWEDGEGYTYVHEPSRFFSCVDALAQRQAGFEAASGDLIVFTHDDHVLAGDFFAYLVNGFSGDAILPTRLKRLEGGREIALPNGGEDGYVSGHAILMRRALVEAAPWS